VVEAVEIDRDVVAPDLFGGGDGGGGET